MKILEYFSRLNDEVQAMHRMTMQSEALRIAKGHAFVCDLRDFSALIEDSGERSLIELSCSQFEVSALEVSYGLYRQAFGTLRRGLETALGAVYFSLYKLEHLEWLQEMGDLNWQSICDINNGALSARASKSLWPELWDETKVCNEKSRLIYRELSQYVHGNKETWDASGVVLGYKVELLQKYFDYFDEISKIIAFALCLRYLKKMSMEKVEDAHGLTERLAHIEAIRKLTGGPEDLH